MNKEKQKMKNKKAFNEMFGNDINFEMNDTF